ncbi:bifunctional RNase H/acid phosphatase [Longispora sp. NPDC051575]|uniref:bifunctional RNase H/acid phosphatase n=1 Tax=Longispora sp. NPDC051575 TaxID=3154943 RepID=UPI00342791BD
MTARVVVEADGGSRGNPGPAGYGAVVLDPQTGAVLAERADVLGIATNNVAEYSGLIAGLRAAGELGARHVDVRMDSKLVVEQMSGRWQIKHEGLKPLAREAAALARGFERVTYKWIPRAENGRADALANSAMDGTPVSRNGPAAGGTAADASAAVAGQGSGAASKAGTTSASAGATSAAARAGSGAAPATQGASAPGGWVPRVEAPTRLILVRHGETPRTAEKRYSGRGDVPLTDRGQAQAKAAAGRVGLIADDVAAIVCSPLTRTRQTAEAIAARYARKPILEPDLIECDFGTWEGLTFGEVSAQWPGELTAWLGDTSLAPPGGESFDQVAERVRGAVAGLRAKYSGKTIVVVSHVSPIKVALREALDGGPGFLHQLHLDPAGVSLVDSWRDGGVSVRLVNDTSHLTHL